MIIRCLFFFFKQKSAYEMRISDWSSDVCSSDLSAGLAVWRRCRRHGGEPVAADRALRRQRKAGRTDRASDAKQPSACGAERGFARDDPVSWTRQPCQIGRASCRESGCQYVEMWVVAVDIKKKKENKRMKR